MKMPFEMKTQEKIAKIEQINRLRNKLQSYSKEYKTQSTARQVLPKIELNPNEQFLLQELIVLAKDSIKGVQIPLFSDETPLKVAQ